jgi:acylpyruvate hydrolase
MKFATYRPKEAQQPGSRVGVVVDGRLVDLNYAYAALLGEGHASNARAVADAVLPPEMTELLLVGDEALDAARIVLERAKTDQTWRGLDGERLGYGLDEVILMAPIPRPGKILAAGKNYADHAAEGPDGAQAPPEVQKYPRGFVKVSSAVVGPEEPVPLPHVTTQLDYEVELAVVIGKAGRYISRDDAYDYIVGYTVLNDLSARDIQLEESAHGNHLIGKNMDGLSPMGPWLVLKDEIPDPMNLRLQCRVNGELRQDAKTSGMINDIPRLVEMWSWGTLEPGDVIATGTPAGVALSGRFPYLKAGDVMECEIESIGVLRTPLVAEQS